MQINFKRLVRNYNNHVKTENSASEKFSNTVYL